MVIKKHRPGTWRVQQAGIIKPDALCRDKAAWGGHIYVRESFLG